jgi:hypothetical protein
MPGQLVPSRLAADKKLAFKVERVAELPRRAEACSFNGVSGTGVKRT